MAEEKRHIRHDLAYKRFKDMTRALRKQQIDRDLSVKREDGTAIMLYASTHQYSKNKIHCSCPMCRAKTRNKGRGRSPFAPAINYSIADRRKQDAMDADILEYSDAPA